MNRIRQVLGTFAMLGLAGALPATPALAASLDAGTVEVRTSVQFSHASYSFQGDHVANTTLIDATAGVGYCFTSLFEIDGALQLLHQSADEEGGGSVSATAFGFSAGPTLNFSMAGNIVPFVSAGAGILSHSGDGYENSKLTVIAPYARAGLRFMMGTAASLNLALSFAHHTRAEGVEDLTNNEFGLSAGLSIFPNRIH
jgi:hypothetical protein